MCSIKVHNNGPFECKIGYTHIFQAVFKLDKNIPDEDVILIHLPVKSVFHWKVLAIIHVNLFVYDIAIAKRQFHVENFLLFLPNVALFVSKNPQ